MNGCKSPNYIRFMNFLGEGRKGREGKKRAGCFVCVCVCACFVVVIQKLSVKTSNEKTEESKKIGFWYISAFFFTFNVVFFYDFYF